MFEKLLAKISRGLNSLKISYMVIGGQAVLVYGEPRLTKDIDITLGVGVDHLDNILNLVKRLGFDILVDDVQGFVKKTMTLPVVDKESGIRLDLIFSFSDYERQAIANAKKIKIGGAAVSFASLEDVVIHKIIAGRPRDLEDVKSVLLKSRNYDSKYILRWLKKFDKSLGSKFTKSFKTLVAGITK